MSTRTSNLGLFKYDTVNDSELPFSIDTALNANWDNLDISNCNSHCQMDVYTEGYDYIKLASFNFNNTGNYDFDILFWVEYITSTTESAYALCRLKSRWNKTSYSGTTFTIEQRFGSESDIFKSLVFAYKYTSTNSRGYLEADLWIKGLGNSYRTFIFKPITANYGDFGANFSNSFITTYHIFKSYAEGAYTEIPTDYVQQKVSDRGGTGEIFPVIETYVNGTSWYRVYSDGWCEQGGTNTDDTNIVITLLKPYRDTNYSVIATPASNNTKNANFSAAIGTRTTTQFNLSFSNNITGNSCNHWRAYGYIEV